jgi:hypothetical protein
VEAAGGGFLQNVAGEESAAADKHLNPPLFQQCRGWNERRTNTSIRRSFNNAGVGTVLARSNYLKSGIWYEMEISRLSSSREQPCAA